MGENSDTPLYSNCKIKTHAEMDALNKVKSLLKRQKIQKNKIGKMNLLVIRVTKTGELCESAPCFHCTKELAMNNHVQIDKLYFSRSNGTITCVKFNDWIYNGNHHVSKGWRWLARNNCS